MTPKRQTVDDRLRVILTTSKNTLTPQPHPRPREGSKNFKLLFPQTHSPTLHGIMQQREPPRTTATPPQGLRLYYAPQATQLADVERAALTRLVDSLGRGSGPRLAIHLHDATGPGGLLRALRRAQLEQELAQLGVAANRLQFVAEPFGAGSAPVLSPHYVEFRRLDGAR